jgi:hypothetical protein
MFVPFTPPASIHAPYIDRPLYSVLSLGLTGTLILTDTILYRLRILVLSMPYASRLMHLILPRPVYSLAHLDLTGTRCILVPQFLYSLTPRPERDTALPAVAVMACQSHSHLFLDVRTARPSTACFFATCAHAHRSTVPTFNAFGFYLFVSLFFRCQQVSHLLHKYTESGYETVLTAACARQGCSAME